MGSSSQKTLQLKEDTAKSFGFEWSQFHEIYQEYEENFLGYIAPVTKEFFKDKYVLDAGCGNGRHSYFAAKYGAEVLAIDISAKAVEVARRNLEAFKSKVIVAKGDIYTIKESPLLWYSSQFQYIYSIGVLHHLPDPQGAFNKLIELLAEGGSISIWVYSKKDNFLAMTFYEAFRMVTTKIPHRLLYYLCYVPATIVEICNRLRLPIFSYYRRFPFRTKLNDAFDVFSVPSAKYYSIQDIQKWFRDAGFRVFKVSYRMLNGKAKGIKALGVKTK